MSGSSISERAPLVLALGAFVFLANVRGRCDEPPGKLELVVQVADDTVKPGEELDLTLTLRNSGPDPLELYHPDSIHRTSSCWSLTGNVTSPGGDSLTLAPEITFMSLSTEKREHFRHLRPGDAAEIEIHLRADDPSATHTPSGWVGLVPISRAELELPEDAIKRRHGVRGRVFFVSGREVHLGIRDLLNDVFGRPGKYRLDFEYENECTRHWDVDAEGRVAFRAVDGAWSGRLSTALVVTIED